MAIITTFCILTFLIPYMNNMVNCGTYWNKPRFSWSGGVVPFYFRNVAFRDQAFLKSSMEKIESRTCIRFQEKSQKPRGHHLSISVSSLSCLRKGKPRFSALVSGEDGRDELTLRSRYRLADSSRCKKTTEGGILHELFHVLGLMHTQQRADRDKYIDILKENILDGFKYEYNICRECDDLGVPYDCNSIMHAGMETFSTGLSKHTNPTFRVKDNKTCPIEWVGAAFDGRGASQLDWLLLNKIGGMLCSSGTKSKQKILNKSKNCNCTDFINKDGFGQCKKVSRKLKDVTCYVISSSGCQDKRRSTTDEQKFYSAEACLGRN